VSKDRRRSAKLRQRADGALAATVRRCRLAAILVVVALFSLCTTGTAFTSTTCQVLANAKPQAAVGLGGQFTPTPHGCGFGACHQWVPDPKHPGTTDKVCATGEKATLILLHLSTKELAHKQVRQEISRKGFQRIKIGDLAGEHVDAKPALNGYEYDNGGLVVMAVGHWAAYVAVQAYSDTDPMVRNWHFGLRKLARRIAAEL
jgi:hypothetical protein